MLLLTNDSKATVSVLNSLLSTTTQPFFRLQMNKFTNQIATVPETAVQAWWDDYDNDDGTNDYFDGEDNTQH